MFMESRKLENHDEKKRGPIRSSIDFFGSLKKELKTLSWTERKELRKITKVIILSTFIAGFLVYFADLLIQKVLNVMGLLTRLIFG